MSTVNSNEDVDTDGLEVEGYNDGTDKTYLLLEVQNFNGDGTQSINGVDCSGGLYSYLWLGAPGSSSGSRRGEDFAELVADPSTASYNATYDSPYIDDQRVRKNAAINSHPYYRISQNERSTETTVLHTRGGWRDHTDGNRITTTRGDKVEVIGGNYKLIILGRRQWTGGSNAVEASGALNWESSGGITYLYDQVPGQVVDARWVADLNGTFRIKEQTTKGNVVSRYDGMQKEWHFGTTIQERVGSLDIYDANASQLPDIPTADQVASGVDNAAVEAAGFPVCSDFTQLNTEYEQTGAWPPTDNYTRAELSESATGVTPPSADVNFAGYAPDITETTWAYATMDREWARKIVERRGSSGKKIPTIQEYDFAEVIEEYMEVYEYTQTIKLKSGYGHANPKHRDYIKAGTGARINEKQAAEYTGYFDGDAVEAWGCAFGEDIQQGANFAEAFGGGHFSLRLGMSLTMFTGVALDFHLLQPITAEVHLLSKLFRLSITSFHWETNWGPLYKLGFAKTKLQAWHNIYGVVQEQSGASVQLNGV